MINEYLTSLGMEPLTKSMINNYVKKKTIQAPIKKKYAVNQIVDLLLIGFFKNTFTINDIRQGILQITAATWSTYNPKLGNSSHFGKCIREIPFSQRLNSVKFVIVDLPRY